MKTVLIISPHFPPSNLASVHRSRLFAKHLPEFGWQPIILTVHEKYYEEALDHNLEKLLPEDLRIEKVKALPLTKPRLIGDIGLRAYFSLYKRAKKIIKKEKVDFLYIPIPSFYCALLGRWLNRTTGIKYGIDYIDPWVHKFPGSDKKLSRHWWSSRFAVWAEPIAVKKASLITGVAEGYYSPVRQRNPHLDNTCLFGALPYGGEKEDHEALKNLTLKPYLFQKNNKLQLIYAGAMLPKAYAPLEAIFQVISANREEFRNVEFHFVGTGSSPNDEFGYNTRELAEKYGLWNSVVFEYPRRIPYLDVLVHLSIADGIFILGSTEPHYTPSKTYQAVLSEKPIIAVLHSASTAVDVIRSTNAGVVLDFDGENDIAGISRDFVHFFKSYLSFRKNYSPDLVDQSKFEQFSARNLTKQLAALFEKAAA